MPPAIVPGPIGRSHASGHGRLPNGRYVPCRNPFSERGPDPPHRRSAASATAKDKTVPSSCSEEDTPDLRSKYGNLPESDDRPHASADPPHGAAHATSGHHALRLRTGSKKLRRGRDGPSTVSLPPCSRFPTVATYSPNRRTTETRHMNRTRPVGHSPLRTPRLPETLPLSRSEPKLTGATRARPNHTLYDASRRQPTSVLPTSIAVSTAV